jgi:hypothetical protein
MTDSTRRTVYSILIALYLAVQLALPVRGFLYDKLTTRGNFTWNMYSKLYECQAAYIATLPGGETVEIDYRRFFKRPDRAQVVFHADVLPRFHEHMCRVLREDDEVERIDGICLCSIHDGTFFDLVERDVDICSAPDHGVIPR